MKKGAMGFLHREGEPSDAQLLAIEAAGREQLEFLGKEAEVLLGYSALSTELGSTRLKRTLTKLRIRPFTRSSVERYKQAKEKNSQSFFRRHLWLSIPLLSLLVLPCVAAWAVAYAVFTDLKADAFQTAFTFALAVALSAPPMKLLSKMLGKSRYRWVLTPLNGYSAQVPLPAIETALQVANAIPKARIFVEEFRIPPTPRTSPAPRIPPARIDPFLVVTLGQERFYLECWSEPGFKAEREA